MLRLLFFVNPLFIRCLVFGTLGSISGVLHINFSIGVGIRVYVRWALLDLCMREMKLADVGVGEAVVCFGYLLV